MTREELLQSVANTIADYRKGEIETPTPRHVELWLNQFPHNDQAQVLSETAHVLKSTYIGRETAKVFINNLIVNQKLAGEEPRSFWKDANFLSIQKDGNSQADFLKLFNDGLAQFGFTTEQSGGGDKFIYLDDVIFTGGRAGNDLEPWIRQTAPNTAIVHIVVMGVHEFGSWKMRERLKKAATECGKNITVKVWCSITLENRMKYKNNADVLWPTSLPEEAKEYTVGKFPFVARTIGGTNKIFSSEADRSALEQALVQAGMKIRGFSQNPSSALRPLGFSPFGVGFGSTIVTYRNCPNNAPLALWWGDPDAEAGHPFSKWRPLVPRKTYGGAGFDD